MKPIEVKRKTLRYLYGTTVETEDRIVTEYPLTIKINSQEFITLVCTPDYLEDLVIGYLSSEGVINSLQDIEDLWIQEKEGIAHIKTHRTNPYYQSFQNRRYVTSCCGMSRPGFVFVNDALRAKKMDKIQVCLSIDDAFRLMNDLEKSAALFHETGGAHNAALCDVNGLMVSRTDIGRHNALDKIYGYCLKSNLSIFDKIIVFSGRISSEILLKVAKIGCEVILSKSAPTELALQLAEQLGITTVGFIRGESLNVYTRPERISDLFIKESTLLNPADKKDSFFYKVEDIP